MVNANWWVFGNMAGLWLLLGGQGAIAQEVQPESVSPSNSVPALTDEGALPATETWQTYVLPRSFSLQIPAEWTAEGIPEDRSATIHGAPFDPAETALSQPTALKTEVRFFNEHPDTFVNRTIASFVEKNYPVKRYIPVRVNDRTALRLWISDLPEDYTSQIVTFVGYASYGTALIVTYYNTPSSETNRLIEQVHDSFELLF